MTTLAGTDIAVVPLHRLVLGVRPIDRASGRPLARPVHVDEELPFADTSRRRSSTEPLNTLRPLESSGTARFKLRLGPRVRRSFTVRIYDHDRHIVPRRFEVEVWGVPVPGQPLPQAEDLAAADNEPPGVFIPVESRVLQAWLFPGSAHPLSGATGMRGRVTHSSRPLRWVRIEAVRPGTNQVIGLAHGDERGEFVLTVRNPTVVWPSARTDFDVELIFYTAPSALTAPTADEIAARQRDQLVDLPIEVVPRTSLNHAPAELDNGLVRGEDLPATYTQSTRSAVVHLTAGRITTVSNPYIVP